MQFLKKLWGKKSARAGIVAISLMPRGIAIAIANTTKNKDLRLIHSEFIATVQAEEQQAILTKLVIEHNLFDYACHLVLAPEDYRRINIEAPVVTVDEMTDAVRWKINDLIDFPIDNAIIDYYAAPESLRASGTKMLEVIVSRDDLIKAYAKICTNAGLDLRVIDIQETSLRNLALLLPENNSGVGVLHLLEASGTLLIQKEGQIYLSRKFELGYRKLNLDDNFELSEQTLIEQSNLVLEIQRSLDYVESYYGIAPISILAIIPLAENTLDLLSMLNNHHGMTARVMDLSTLVECDSVMDDMLQSLCTPVIGATLRYVAEAL
ncbi:MAG: pilus assembly protein PilM [Methylococcaceae bacterium]|nr:pilus assembly protein PilM [Methylococcaceae bacterium]